MDLAGRERRLTERRVNRIGKQDLAGKTELLGADIDRDLDRQGKGPSA